MASQIVDENNHRENAEVFYGEDVCKQKSIELLEAFCLPKGLLPTEIVELGHNTATGFIWCKQKTKKEHRFRCINKVVSYDTEVTMFAEKGRLRNLNGVKSKELFIWIAISDIFIEDPSSGKIIFAVPNGMSRAYPVSAFELQLEQRKDNDQKTPITLS